MLILSLDPGPVQTGYCVTRGMDVVDSGVLVNKQMRDYICEAIQVNVLAVEMIASYGMPVGREVFETCVWIGRFVQSWRYPEEARLVYRKDVKLHLCGTTKAKDPNVRQALIDLYPRTGGGKTPQIGTKGQPGPLYGVSTHAWPALGVAVTVQSQLRSPA
jgi:hypothetical protein